MLLNKLLKEEIKCINLYGEENLWFIYRYVDNFLFSFYISVLYLLKWLIIIIFLFYVYYFIINEWIKKKFVKIFELWNLLLGNWYKIDDWLRNVYIVFFYFFLLLMCFVDLLFIWMWLLFIYI